MIARRGSLLIWKRNLACFFLCVPMPAPSAVEGCLFYNESRTPRHVSADSYFLS
jgi:hypothetical protein